MRDSGGDAGEVGDADGFFMKQIPPPSKKRLVTLARLLSQMDGKAKVTSASIAEIAGWGEATVRRDISLLKLNAGRSNGYSVRELKNSIEEKLALKSDESERKCCVVGLSELSAPFLKDSFLRDSGFSIVAGFDSSLNRIEIAESDFPLFSTSIMESVVKSQKIGFAILCVPDELAQSVAEKLVSAGIRGILNFTRTVLALPKGVRVENANPAVLLGNLV